MSTRSVIATGTLESWSGHFVHWDGYPTARGPALWAIVHRDGLDGARKCLLEDYAEWSTVVDDQPDITGVTPDESAPWGTPASAAARIAIARSFGDDSLVNVPGYGTARPFNPATSEWVITNTGDDGGTEWAYVLADKALIVFERRYGAPTSDEGHGTGMFGLGASATDDGGYWRLAGTFDWSGKEPDWQAVETSGTPAAT